MINIIKPNNQDKIKQLIKAIEWQLKHDTNDKDKTIHQQALETLNKQLLGGALDDRR